jgi:ribonuclease P protein component
MAASGGSGRRRGRLSRSGDFDRVYKEGRSHANRYLVVYAFPRSNDEDQEDVRLGVSVGRKLGGAVERNAVKRAFREAFWALGPALPERHDFVLVARPDAGELVERDGTDGARRALEELLTDAGLIQAGVYRETQEGGADDGAR